ncbi:MAG TPA: prepilin-type N-terminal cleavage/methylation domain-containing protein [Gemmatimonadaceae bacterium]|jgi:prepilin-type N-terminal cleavage/methylation domain-containing protein
MTQPNRPGFTLIEAIVVACVIGIVAATGAPKVSAALQKRTSAAAADQLVLTHSLARSTAIRFGRIAQLHIDAVGQRFWVDVDTSANGIGQRATIANIRYANDPGLSMTSNRALLCFDARGIASTLGSCESGDVQVVFKEGQTADTVSTTSLGKVLR